VFLLVYTEHWIVEKNPKLQSVFLPFTLQPVYTAVNLNNWCVYCAYEPMQRS